MKKKLKKKSYDYGGNIDLSQYQNIDYIDNPAEIITQNNINFAKAKAQVAANPLIQGGKMLGKLATGVGSKMVSGALGDMADEGKLGKVGGFLGKQSDTLIPLGLQGLDMFGKNQNINSFAFGGKVPVEVEGDEAFELPNGKAGMFKGPSHEEGGIDVDLPEGTDIFSDRISIDGKTMAERKAGRERKLKSFTKRLDKNSSDQILKNTVSRIEQSNSLQEEEDKQIQEMINMVKQGPRKKFGLGGGIFKNYVGPNTEEEQGLITRRMFPFDNMEDTLDSERLNHNNKLKKKALSFVPQKWNPITNAFENDLTPDLEDMDINIGPETTNYANTVINPNADKISTQPNVLKSDFQDISLDGVGDFLAMSGDIGQSYLPYLNTLNQRSTDQPNINPNKNVGIDSVETIQDSKGYVKQLRDKALTDLELNRTAQTKRGRNSARGVNTQRALDLATLQIANKGQNDIYDDSVKQMLAIVNQEADAKFKRDAAFAEGEAFRNMNDRKDKDAFYTQHGANLRNLGQSISKTGKNLNKIKENKDEEDILNQFFDNFEFDFSTGKIKAKTKSK